MPARVSRNGSRRGTVSRSNAQSRHKDGASRRRPELVIISGMSGSGKASVLKVFEDLGYYAVDNLPMDLLSRFAELARSSDVERTALVVDVREGAKLDRLPMMLKQIKRQLRTTVLFLEAKDEVLLRRFSETRRPHPLGASAPV